MIHHTYSSSIISLSTSISFNQYSCYSNERCPSMYCSCCCSFPVSCPRFIAPVNPSFLYGLRQSTLIQWPPSRRLVVGSGDRYCLRSPVSDLGRCRSRECCCCKRERVDCRVLGKVCKEKSCVKKMGVNVSDDRTRGRIGMVRRGYRCRALGDAEAMLSLLAEETVEECLDVRGQRRSLFEDGNVICKEIGVRDNFRDRKENSRSGNLGGRSGRHQLELGVIKSKEEGCKRREEREVLLKEEERRPRRRVFSSENLRRRLDKVGWESSKVQSRKHDYRRREGREDFSKEEQWSRRNESSSSCYSASEMSDLESDIEVEIQDKRLVAESSVRYEMDSRQMKSFVTREENNKESRKHRDERDQQWQNSVHDDFRVGSSAVWNSTKKSEGIVINEGTKRESERYRDERNQQLLSKKHDDVKVGSVTEWDWRKKSEKRLTEDSSKETKSRKDSVVRHSQMSQAHESNSMKALRSEKQFNHQEEQSISGANYHGQLRSRIRKDNEVGEYSKSSSKHEQPTQTARHNVETTSNIQRRLNQGEEGVMVVGQSVQESGCEYCKTCGRTMQQNNTQMGSKQSVELSQLCDDARWTSLQSSVHEENQQHVNTMRKHHYSGIVDTHDNYVKDVSSSHQQPESLMKNLEVNASSLNSRQEVKGLQRKSGRTVIEEIESSRVAQTGASASRVHSTNVEINRQSGSEQRYSETVDTHDSYVEGISSPRHKSESLMKNLESSLISRQEAKRLQEKSGHKVIKEIESSRVAQTVISASQGHSTKVEINRQSASEQHIYNEQIYSTKVKSEEELVEKRKHTNEQAGLRTEVQRPIVEAAHTGKFSGEDTVSPPSTALIFQTGVQQVSQEEAKSHLLLTVSSPSVDPLSRITSIDSGGITKVGAASVYANPQARTPLSSNEIESNRVTQTGVSALQVYSTNAEINRPSASEHRVYNEQIYPTMLKSKEELVEKRIYIDERIVQSRVGTELQRPLVETTYTGNFSGEALVSQPSVALISQAGVLQVREEEAKSSLQLPMSPSGDLFSSNTRNDPGGITEVDTASVFISPESNEVSSGSESYEEPSLEDSLGSAERMEVSSVQIVGGFMDEIRHEASTSQSRMETKPPQDSEHQVRTGSPYAHHQARTPSSEVVGRGGSEHSEEPSGEDILVSAERMEESSVQIVGEFVEKMRHEASNSQTTIMKKQSQLDLGHQDEKYTMEGSTQSDSEKTVSQAQESRRSSGGSETKGPSDEMWDAKDHFAHESSVMESSEGLASENVMRRTGKSLWNIVAGILRLQSGSHAETQKSSVKAGGHSSSNESVRGEVLSSEDEANEANDASTNIKGTNLPQDLTSSLQPLQRRTSSRSRREDLGMVISDDRMSNLEVGASSSSSVFQIGVLSGGVSSGAKTNLNVTQEMSQSTPLDLSAPPTRRLRRSDEFEGIEESGHSEGPTKATGEQGQLSFGVGQSELKIASGVTNAEMKQRKLQRSDQVLHERYYEWENAFRREREQLKVDEIFMREALVEAKKAADSWEVPVGAVLVLNGNVIARGYNLVEELRDSTAHAEMICIREASKVLQTWRLSESTLYVTLEPCPMCAGAVLQARVGTLVWGAPNKLLGADGSWIRLFPDGVVGEERPEVADKPAAPIHPFHPNMKIRRGVLEAECADIMQQFFQLRRRKEMKKSEESGQKPKLLHKIFKFPAIHRKYSS